MRLGKQNRSDDVVPLLSCVIASFALAFILGEEILMLKRSEDILLFGLCGCVGYVVLAILSSFFVRRRLLLREISSFVWLVGIGQIFTCSLLSIGLLGEIRESFDIRIDVLMGTMSAILFYSLMELQFLLSRKRQQVAPESSTA